MTQDPRVRCDDCDTVVRKTLVERATVPEVKLACACRVFDGTRGLFRPFDADLPDAWVRSERADAPTTDD